MSPEDAPVNSNINRDGTPASFANLLSFDAKRTRAHPAYEAGFLFRSAEGNRPVQRLKA